MKSLKLSAFLFTALLSHFAFAENQSITKITEISRMHVSTLLKVSFTPSPLLQISKPQVFKTEQEFNESGNEVGEPPHCEMNVNFNAGEIKVTGATDEQKIEASVSRFTTRAHFSFPLQDGGCNYTPKNTLNSYTADNGYHDMTLHGDNGQTIDTSFYILQHLQFQWDPTTNTFTANQNNFDFKSAYLFFDNQNVGAINFYTEKEWADELALRKQPSTHSED